MPSITHQTGINNQNIMRLRVNRIALVQDLRVEHVCGRLLKVGVIELQDIATINKGTTAQDRTRLLLDLLPTKSRSTEWYKHFKESLQNPDDAGPETRRRCKLLVNFLDNTVIHRPTSQVSRFRDRPAHDVQEMTTLPRNIEQSDQAKLPYYSALPEIEKQICPDSNKEKIDNSGNNADLETDGENMQAKYPDDSHSTMTLVQGLFHQWLPTPENFRSLLDIPDSHRQRLLNSENSEAQEILANEEMALNKLRQVEVIAALARHKHLPSGFELCLCDAVQDILNHPELYHLCLKHFMSLEAADVMLIKEICSSYEGLLQTVDCHSVSEIVNKVTQTGLKLASMLTATNKFSDAGSILINTIQFLKQSTDLKYFIPRYQAYIKLMHTWNLACQPDMAESAYFEAVQMQYQITMMSFGQNMINDAELHAETSCMMLEHGSISSAFGWSRRALKEVDHEDHAAVVRVLCVAINSCCAHWHIKKAELLAIYVVQYARNKFGERHPMFIEALLHFCHFSSEFKQDQVGLQASKDLLDAAEKTYGCESIQVAQAHRAISKALMCMHMLDTDDYYTHALEAVRISQAVLDQHSPLLHYFLYTFANALQLKSLRCQQEVFDATLRWAEMEAKKALALVTELFGEISLKSGQILLLLGQIYSKMNKINIAEKCLKQAVDYMKLCQPSSSYYLLQGMANLANFYTIVLKPDLAVPLFQFIVDHAESTGRYLKWVHECFEDLTQLYEYLGQEKSAEVVKGELTHWLKANPMNSKPIDYAS
uniref:CARD domain-containing protein n=1 Tax=Arion vulgaris TaxID=1028688 RepID=A0A0B7A282_9EUPU